MIWDYDKQERRYIRDERTIHSPFWRAIHNLVAHPMLTIYRPLGVKLHDWTAEHMYKDKQSLTHVDKPVTATRD